MFPLVIRRRPDDPEPDAPIVFVVGRNGVFVRKTTVAFRATVPADELPMLAPIATGAEYLLPTTPPEVTARAVAFFRRVYAAHWSEATLLVAYHARRRTFRLDAPPQVVSAASCRYALPVRAADGFTFVGTIHSHAAGSAGHSCVDDRDERTFDGLHCTFGRLDQPDRFDVAASLVVSGQRTALDPTRVFGGLRRVAADAYADVLDAPQSAATLDAIIARYASDELDSAAHPVPSLLERFRRARYAAPSRPPDIACASRSEGYAVDVPPEVPMEEVAVDPTWLARVRPLLPAVPARRRFHRRSRHVAPLDGAPRPMVHPTWGVEDACE